jgi:hypothetical protein
MQSLTRTLSLAVLLSTALVTTTVDAQQASRGGLVACLPDILSKLDTSDDE